MRAQDALTDLLSAQTILEKLNVRYFLTDGTLLGVIREKGFIAHDLDVDLGVFFDEIAVDTLDAIKREFAQAGFAITERGEYHQEYELTLEREVKIDVFFYRERGDQLIFHAFTDSGSITYGYEKALLSRLESCEMYGHEFPIPGEPEKLLQAKYGDWRTEKTEWDWAYSPDNIIHPSVTVFTVGCFDLLHEGHAALFDRMAKRIGMSGYDSDCFHVLLHDDLSVFQNKGRFPVQDFDARKRNLNLLKIWRVHWVPEADPSRCIDEFLDALEGREIVYMRGDDWLDFPGKQALLRRGVPVEYAPYTQGISSTKRRTESG